MSRKYHQWSSATDDGATRWLAVIVVEDTIEFVALQANARQNPRPLSGTGRVVGSPRLLRRDGTMEDSSKKEEGIRLFRGMFLVGDEVTDLYDDDLLKFMSDFDIVSIYSYVDDHPAVLDDKKRSTLFSRIKAETHEARVRKTMKEHNANFLLIQISKTKIYYDYCWAD
jgi:hypothetical protein